MMPIDSTVHDIGRMLLIFVHVIACAIAIGFAFFADYRIVKSHGWPTRQDREIVQQVSRFVLAALVVLWISGAGVIVLDFGHLPSLTELAKRPKLVTKLVVVSVLTVNGLLIHAYALPRLRKLDRIAVVTGGISGASWVFAAFVGVGKPLGALLTVGQFLALYALALLIGQLGAVHLYRQAHSVQPRNRPLDSVVT